MGDNLTLLAAVLNTHTLRLFVIPIYPGFLIHLPDDRKELEHQMKPPHEGNEDILFIVLFILLVIVLLYL
ncbi:hypothetical protein [Paenibacillus xylanilyticus]|uniref:hypothetical protein n=1 Tax=Paenibacillus xylanilyticus TaxID=248903 RepID=UPI0039A23DCB